MILFRVAIYDTMQFAIGTSQRQCVSSHPTFSVDPSREQANIMWSNNVMAFRRILWFKKKKKNGRVFQDMLLLKASRTRRDFPKPSGILFSKSHWF